MLEVDLVQLQAVLGGERLRLGLRAARVLGDAKPDVHAVGLVAEPGQRVPQRKAVFAA